MDFQAVYVSGDCDTFFSEEVKECRSRSETVAQHILKKVQTSTTQLVEHVTNFEKIFSWY